MQLIDQDQCLFPHRSMYTVVWLTQLYMFYQISAVNFQKKNRHGSEISALLINLDLFLWEGLVASCWNCKLMSLF